MADAEATAPAAEQPTEQETAPAADAEAKAPEQAAEGEGTSAAAEGAAASAEASEKPKVILHQFPRPPNPQHGPNLSPFCLKMETYLRMAKIPYEVKVAQAKEGPKHKVPFIKVDGQTCTDTGFIIKCLRKRYEVTLDDGLTEEQQAIGHMALRMAEESSYWTILYRRWVEKSEDMPTLFMERPPLKVRMAFKLLTKQIRQNLQGQGTGRHTPAEVAEIVEADLRALSTILGSKPFFLGDQATSTDASIFAMLAEMLWVLPGSAQEKLISSELKNLEEYCGRMRKEYWSDWESLYVPPPQKPQKEKAQKSKDKPKEKPAEDAKKAETVKTEEKADEKAEEGKPAEGDKPEEKPEAAAEEKPKDSEEAAKNE